MRNKPFLLYQKYILYLIFYYVETHGHVTCRLLLSYLLLGVSGLVNFAQQFRVEALVLGGFLSHGTLQGGDLLLGSAQTLLKPFGQTAVSVTLGLH